MGFSWDGHTLVVVSLPFFPCQMFFWGTVPLVLTKRMNITKTFSCLLVRFDFPVHDEINFNLRYSVPIW
jgi:hypothetical protein